jgi:hypothetical protein
MAGFGARAKELSSPPGSEPSGDWDSWLSNQQVHTSNSFPRNYAALTVDQANRSSSHTVPPPSPQPSHQPFRAQLAFCVCGGCDIRWRESGWLCPRKLLLSRQDEGQDNPEDLVVRRENNVTQHCIITAQGCSGWGVDRGTAPPTQSYSDVHMHGEWQERNGAWGYHADPVVHHPIRIHDEAQEWGQTFDIVARAAASGSVQQSVQLLHDGGPRHIPGSLNQGGRTNSGPPSLASDVFSRPADPATESRTTRPPCRAGGTTIPDPPSLREPHDPVAPGRMPRRKHMRGRDHLSGSAGWSLDCGQCDLCTMIRTGRGNREGVGISHELRIEGAALQSSVASSSSRDTRGMTAGHRVGDCRVCGDAFRSRGLVCSANIHRICRACLGGYVNQQLEVLIYSVDKFRQLTINGGRLSCVEPECKGILRTDDMYNLIDWGPLGLLAEWASRATDARMAAEGVNLGADGADSLAALFPNAVMCPKCLCGPVEPAYCDDMLAHHGQRFQSCTTQIDNRCHGCNWFGATRQDWIAWDGVVRHAQEHCGA